MTQTVFEKMKTAISVLKLDFTTEEFATFADDQELSEEAIEAVQTVFSYISEKKQQTTVQTLLKLSRLPKKAPKTFENFDFSLLKSRDLDWIRALPSLGAVYSHRNLAFIGPPGTGKTHLAQAFGYACCQHGMRAYFIVTALRPPDAWGKRIPASSPRSSPSLLAVRGLLRAPSAWRLWASAWGWASIPP